MDPVQRVGVGLILGEFCVHARVALRARRDDPALRQPRARIADGEHIVVAVAIVAGGDVRGDIGLAERHRLAVIGFVVVCQPVLVAFAARLVALGLEMRGRGLLDVVRAVAIGAHRAPRVALEQQLAVNAGVVGLFDAEVALAAGIRDIGVAGVRVPVDAAPDVVHPVATRAGRRDDQPHLHQRATVNAVEEMRGGGGLPHPVVPRQLGVVMAFAAGLGQVELEHGRVGLHDRHDVVRAVTARARSSVGVAHLAADAMDARGILAGGLLVT